MRNISIALLLSLFATAAVAAGDYKKPKQIPWQFDGIFGTVDKQSAQRGFQVYREVCSSCHGLKRIAFRNLASLGFSEAEIKALAAEYTITDGPNDEGEMFDRPGKPFDRYPSPYPNEQAARSVNNGAYPPDMSLIIKARMNGANYVYSLMTGYQEAPEGYNLGAGQYYNPYMAGKKIAMPPQLMEGMVDYQDGTVATEDQMARDIVNFLQWAAEPEMEERKRMGIKVLIFLTFFTVFFYLAMKRIWKKVKPQ